MCDAKQEPDARRFCLAEVTKLSRIFPWTAKLLSLAKLEQHPEMERTALERKPWTHCQLQCHIVRLTLPYTNDDSVRVSALQMRVDAHKNWRERHNTRAGGIFLFHFCVEHKNTSVEEQRPKNRNEMTRSRFSFRLASFHGRLIRKKHQAANYFEAEEYTTLGKYRWTSDIIAAARILKLRGEAPFVMQLRF